MDFVKILSTNSPDDALALLIAMYTIFELSFDKKSRTIRFLYSVLHGEKQFLSNSIRHLINEKNIDIDRKPAKASSTYFNTLSSNSTTSTTTTIDKPNNQTQIDTQSSDCSSVTHACSTGAPTNELSSLTDDCQLDNNTVIDITE